MAKKRITQCVGIADGQMIKTNSIPFDRLDENSTNAALKDFMEGVINQSWGENWVLSIIDLIKDDPTFKKYICALGCGGGGGLNLQIEPTSLVFKPEGGTQQVRVITDNDQYWEAQ